LLHSRTYLTLTRTTWHSPCTSVGFRPQASWYSFLQPVLENPPPCNEYYLMYSCSKEVNNQFIMLVDHTQKTVNQNRCKYSHEYPLTDEQLAQLSKSAKQSPCWYLNTDKECPNANCCWGHVCPFGIACYHLSRDKCRFKGSGMHRPQGASHTDSSSRSA